ncbi:MAG: hydroxyacylglutathione hydrolase [Verrucomicrobiales bacterium]|jgi:hydroxyacylglutathione hydrolase
MLNIKTYTGGMATTNGYACQVNESCFLVDAPEGMGAWVESSGMIPMALLLTHAHFDHVLDAAMIQERWKCPIFAFTDPTPELTLEVIFASFGPGLTIAPYRVDEYIQEGQSFKLAGLTFQVLHVPGHSADSIVLLPEDTGILFGGDVLFNDGVGRSDFPGCDGDLLRKGIREKVYSLDGDLKVLSGHGEPTTVGKERLTNPFVRA